MMTLGTLVLVAAWMGVASIGYIGSEQQRREERRRGHELSDAIDNLTQELQLAVAALDAAREEVNEREDRLRLLSADRDSLADRLAATIRKAPNTEVASREKMQRLGAEIAGGAAKASSLLDRLHERTTKTVNDLEQAIRSTGIDVDKALAAARTVPPGLGGPFIQFDPTKGDGSSGSAMRLDASLARFAGLQSVIRHMPLAEPLTSSVIMSGFGRRIDPFTDKPAMHTGIDLSANIGTPIYTTAPGRVTIADISGQYGKLVEVDHGFGFKTRYGHLRQINVKAGERVALGDSIGSVGSSGRSTGPHLHYEVLYKENPMDPANFIEAGNLLLRDGKAAR